MNGILRFPNELVYACGSSVQWWHVSFTYVMCSLMSARGLLRHFFKSLHLSLSLSSLRGSLCLLVLTQTLAIFVCTLLPLQDGLARPRRTVAVWSPVLEASRPNLTPPTLYTTLGRWVFSVSVSRSRSRSGPCLPRCFCSWSWRACLGWLT